MIKTLRITSFVLAAAAVGAVVLLAVLGFKSNPGIEAILAQDGVIEQAKRLSQSVPEKEETISPLVSQARKFALRINPPPPPVPPAPPTPPRPITPTVQSDSVPAPREPVSPPFVEKPQTSGRYTLLATAHYADYPERSLALFKPVVGPSKWHFQGETLGHLEIREIRDGSVVLYQGDTLNSELVVPKPATRGKPLLKSELDSSTAAAVQPGATAAATAVAAQPSASSARSVGVTRTPAARNVDATERIRRVRAAPVTQPSEVAPLREPTPEEQKESIQQSISSIEEIMARSDAHASEEERIKEQEAWMQLLQVLQQEKVNLEATGENPDNAPSPSEPAREANRPAADASESSSNN